MEGLTGPIKFDARGFRTDFNMDIIELKQEGLIKVCLKCNVLQATFIHMYYNRCNKMCDFKQLSL